MSFISDYIIRKNSYGEKVLSVFLTSGFPNKNNFTQLALQILDAGADMIEIGFPFSDPLADGPTIQYSSFRALQNGVNIKLTLSYAEQIRKKSDKPIILMGYANPLLKYGVKNFAADAVNCGVNGIIVPDVPLDEYDDFYTNAFSELDVILLAAPTTSDKRIKKIDELSKGFLYLVSTTGTTGRQIQDMEESKSLVIKVSHLVTKNPLLVGFGIKSTQDAALFAPYCNGVIVGSAIVKSLMMDNEDFRNTLTFVKEFKTSINTK
ncbi:MAG: tryptophan synthase subunit alpha [Ignavibacteriaceae bacterium]|nr:tryptophan synthase subunit alpha [Ignavibacteriaceae bacterium]